MFPGENLIGVELSLCGRIDTHTGFIKGFFPYLVVETPIPKVEPCAVAPGGLDDIGYSSVGSADSGFEQTSLDAVEFEVQTVGAKPVQVSVPVLDPYTGGAIGAMTVGVNLEALE